MTRLGMASGETRTKKVQFCEPNSGRRKGRSTRKNDIRNDRIDDPLPLDDSPTHCHSSAGTTSKLLSMVLILLRSMLGRRLTIQLASLQIRSPQLIALSVTLLLP